MRFDNLRFRTRLLLVGLVFLVGLAILLMIETRTLSRVMVNGELYHDIARAKDVIADILPPPLFIVETTFLCTQLVEEDEPLQRQRLESDLRKARAAYAERRDHWQRHHPPGALRDALLVASYAPVEEFFDILDRKFLPAVTAAAAAERAIAKEILDNELLPLYRRHRGAIIEAVGLAEREVKAVEAHAEDEVTAGKVMAALLGAGIALLIALFGWWVLRSIPRSMDVLIGRMRDLAESEADLSRRIPIDSSDEVGDLAKSVNRFIEKIAGLVKAVRRSSIQLTSTSTQMAATSRQQQASVNSFGASTNQVAAAVQEITATGTELMRTMDEVGSIARSSASLAGTGRSSLGSMSSTMRQLEESSASVSGKLSEINEKAGEITSVVTTITKVADQTNLLSVNAAIEAEKAGEYGRGFHVVAQEIRRLADQTGAATLDIERTVQQMHGAVSAGVMEMDKFSDRVRRTVHDVGDVSAKLGEIISQVEVLTGRFGTVRDGMATQTKGADQIGDATRHLAENVQQTITGLGEFTAAAEDMRKAATLLKEEIAQFRLDDYMLIPPLSKCCARS